LYARGGADATPVGRRYVEIPPHTIHQYFY
jgi:hypothetical protein